MDEHNLTLGEAALSFLTSLSPQERKETQQEVNEFVRWYGRERAITGLSPSEVASYAERLAPSVATKKIAPVRAFLIYTHKERLVKTNLATHLKMRTGGKKVKPPLKAAREQLEARAGESDSAPSSTAMEEEATDTLRVGLRSRVILRDLTSGEELSCTLVNPNEIDAAKGKISAASPLGKALWNQRQGDITEVAAPLGTLRYRIEKIDVS